MQAILYEINNLKNTITIYSEKNEYIYTNIYEDWVKEYNSILNKYNNLMQLNISNYKLSDYDLSSTQKTVREPALTNFIKLVDMLSESITTNMNNFKPSEVERPKHQMRRCFKFGIEHCPLNPALKNNKIFIAMSFANEYHDSYQYGIIPALEGLGYEYFRADEEIRNTDIMCKICKEIQSSELIIVNISGLNPNVMLEQGLAYGLGKSVIIIKDVNTKAISDLGSIEYIEYNHAYDLQTKLIKALENKSV